MSGRLASAFRSRGLRVGAAAALFVAAFAAPVAAYVGPGAGFAFLSSFLVFFLTFVLALFSFVSWPFRFLWRLVRGRRAYRDALADRVVILGLDGMEPSLAEKYIAEGKLPNLARLRAEGFYGRLATTTPAISPVAWSSFMTGSEPSKHNIFDFLSRDPRTYLPDLSSARIGRPRRVLSLGRYDVPLSKPEIRGLRRSVTFWKILGERGVFSTVLRVPITFPPEKFRGHMLSGMCAPDLKGSQGTFAFYTSDPARIAKREGGVAVPVTVEGNVVRTVLSGPENTLRKGGGDIELPLTVRIDPAEDAVVIEACGQKVPLAVGEFSPWTRLTFKPGLGLQVRSICRFYVRSVRPRFEMYVTPLNIDPEKPALPISHPFIYAAYLSKLLGRFITLGEANDTWALNEGVLDEKAFLELTYANHDEWERMLFNALHKTKKGLTAIVFETTDSIQHMFWRYLDKTHPALKAGRPALGPQVIEDLYVRMDGLVGRVRERLGPRDVLLVMSDHGFKPFRRGVHLNAWLRRNGYLALKDGAKGDGEWFKDVDWSKTRAYGLGLGGLYLNIKGREACGIVEPDEVATLKKELIERLAGWTDPETGGVAVLNVYDRDAVYAGPYRENAPDLIMGYNEGYRVSWDSVTGKCGDALVEDNVKAWSGDHCIDPGCVPGVLFSSLPLADGRPPSIMDVAPTVLELFAVKPPAHMDGRSLLGEARPGVAANSRARVRHRKGGRRRAS